MRKAIEIDEQQGCKEQERIFQLEVSFKLQMWVKTVHTKIYARKYIPFKNICIHFCGKLAMFSFLTWILVIWAYDARPFP